MAETHDLPRKRMSWQAWLGVALAVVLVAALATWAVLNFRPAGTPSASGPSASASAPPRPTTTPTPQATEFATPEPGATAPAEKPGEPVEVALDEPAQSLDDIVVDVTSLEALTAGRDVPGETSGPAIAVSVRITNNGDAAIDTSGANVNLAYGGDERIPAVALTGDDAAVWPVSIAAGEDATAVFVFSVPQVPDGDIRVIVDLLASAPDVVFVGPRP